MLVHSNEYQISAGYPTFKGQVLNGQQLWDLIEGLEANDLLYYTHLLTGTFIVHVLFTALWFTEWVSSATLFCGSWMNFVISINYQLTDWVLTSYNKRIAAYGRFLMLSTFLYGLVKFSCVQSGSPYSHTPVCRP